MKLRFYNGRVLSLKDGSMNIEKSEVHTDGNKISFIGDSDIPKGQFDREIDLDGNLLMPAFKNAHTHSPMTFLRSFADDMPLFDWLNKQIFPKEACLLDEDVYNLSKLAILEYLSSGICSNFDMYAFQEANVKASVDCGFRTCLVSPLNDFVSSLEELDSDCDKYNHYDPLISFRPGFHAEYTTSEELLKGVARISHKYSLPVYTHNSETKREVRECIERHGMTPTSYLDSLGVYDNGGGGYHCLYLSDQDIEIFRKRKMNIVVNSGSNVKLASGIAPVEKYLENDIRISLGTDGPASNNALDMFREMYLTTGLAKIKGENAAALPGEEVLLMAARNGAFTMGSDNDCIDTGKLADLLVIDLKRPSMQPLNNIPKNLVYSGGKDIVKMTIVNGKILYENGEFFIGEDPLDIYEKANRTIERMR